MAIKNKNYQQKLIILFSLLGGISFFFFQKKKEDKNYVVGGYCYKIPSNYAAMYSGWQDDQHGSMLMIIAKLPNLTPDAYHLWHPEHDNLNPFLDKGILNITLASNELSNASGFTMRERWLRNRPNSVKITGHFENFEIYTITALQWLYVRGSGSNMLTVSCDGSLHNVDRAAQTQGRYGTCNVVFPLFEKNRNQNVYDHAFEIEMGGLQLQNIDEIEKNVRKMLLSWQVGKVDNGHCPTVPNERKL
ncbi:hypothetical protein [Acetobacter indonesiensis]